jgi:hypothetical protein
MKLKYVLLSDKYGSDFFEAESDEDAEKYVEENYTPDDGAMTIHKLTPVCTYP